MSKSQIWLSRFSILCVLATLPLIFVGGMVTSKDAGLAVPDWPLSYGSLNPPGWWHIENVRLEHGHRIIGAVLGILIITLAVWIWRAEKRNWVKWLGALALVMVCVQGLMGGLRVTERSILLAVIHGCTAQAFFCLLLVIATVTSRNWSYYLDASPAAKLSTLRVFSYITVLLVFTQLVLGAVMRHYQAELAIRDFPLAMGKLVPPIETVEVAIHYAHRVGALVLSLWVLGFAFLLIRNACGDWRLLRPLLLLLGLVTTQIILGAYVIWWEIAPLPTTFHVVNGACILGTTVCLATRIVLLSRHGGAKNEQTVWNAGNLSMGAL